VHIPSALSIGAIFASIAVGPGIVQAKDHFLTIGGGYGPTGNQASIENNVLFFQRLLAAERPDQPAHDLFFADGDDPGRDVEVLDVDVKKQCPPARRMMTELCGGGDEIGIVYRNHQVKEIAGATDRNAIRRRFRELGRELKPGDRLFIYMTGHGGSGDSAIGEADYDYSFDADTQQWIAKSEDHNGESEEDAYDTEFLLWDNESVSASEFNQWLDRLHEEVSVVLVMVQCYSGGFAHAIFRQNDAELGLSPANRCGFFAQVHDRPAAGCTSEAREASYQEYSTFFWAALGGKARTGESLERPDYDGDGRTSLAEAHAYTVIESETLDIPNCTSDQLLRRYSRLGARRDGAGADSGPSTPISRFFEKAISASDASQSEWIEPDGPIAKIAAIGRSDQRAIIDGLAEKLQLNNMTSVEEVRSALVDAEAELSDATSKISSADMAVNQTLTKLREDIHELWPEIGQTFTPTMGELTAERADEFVATVEALPAYEALGAARRLKQKAHDQLGEAQQAEARLRRLLWTIESVVLAANLKHAAPAPVVDQYNELLALEQQGLALESGGD
jgi:hypothetical protein